MIKIRLHEVTLTCGNRPVLQQISTAFPAYRISAVVGPSGSGKSSLLLTMNRLWQELPDCRLTGRVEMLLDGIMGDIHSSDMTSEALRRRVGIVFQTPNPLPMSVERNIAFPLLLAGEQDKEKIHAVVEENLRLTGLWHEVRDRLQSPAMALSGGQQQRLCLARALILRPEVLLLDEPTSALDSRTAEVIEDLLLQMRQHCTIVLVSHHQGQVRRIADQVLTLADGRVV